MGDGTKGMSEASDFASVCDDALLLHEFAHRTANEVAAASAAIELAQRGRAAVGVRLMRTAAQRLGAFGELNKVLARPVRAQADVAADLRIVCGAIASGVAEWGSEVRLSLPETWLDGVLARRLVLVAAELVGNAVKHALDRRPGILVVMLEVVDGEVVLVVSDDGLGLRVGAESSSTELGRGMVAELVARADGAIRAETSSSGTTFRVAFPLVSSPGDDEFAF